MLKNVDRSTGSSKQLTEKRLNGWWMACGSWRAQSCSQRSCSHNIHIDKHLHHHSSDLFLTWDWSICISLSLSLPISFSSWDSFGGPHSGWLHNHHSIAWVKILSRQFLVLVLTAESIIFATSNQKALHQWDLHTKGNWKNVYASFQIIILEQYTKPKIMKLAILDFHQIVEQVHACAHCCTSVVVNTKLWL